VEARRNINAQIDDELGFDDNVALARLDTRVEFLQDARQRYEHLVAAMIAAVQAGDHVDAERLLHEIDRIRDEFEMRMEAARNDMRQIASGAILGTRRYQQKVIDIALVLLVIAALVGLTVAAAVTNSMVRPVHRLLDGANAVENGALDTVVPVTSRDEIGRLTQAFNSMVGELRVKAQIREVFGRYVDPRSFRVDRPPGADRPKGFAPRHDDPVL